MKLITIHCEHATDAAPDFSTIEDLKEAYANIISIMGNLREPAPLYINAVWKPFIDPPLKCLVHLKTEMEEMKPVKLHTY